MWGIYQDTHPEFTLVDTFDNEERAYYEAVYLNEESEDYRYYVSYISDIPVHEVIHRTFVDNLLEDA